MKNKEFRSMGSVTDYRRSSSRDDSTSVKNIVHTKNYSIIIIPELSVSFMNQIIIMIKHIIKII